MTKSKINSSRLDMHRKAKNCRLSFENVTNGQQFISRSAATQTRWVRLFERLQLYHIPVQKILSSLRMARAIRSKKTIVIRSKGSPELSVPKRQSPTFRTARRNPLKKCNTLFVQKKIISGSSKCKPFQKISSAFCLATKRLKCACFRVHQTFS